ncbi:MAG: OmpH family outer membrane protein [Francisellaceae bacterium]
MKKLLTVVALSSSLTGVAIAADHNGQALNVAIVNPVAVYQGAPQGEATIQKLQAELKPEMDSLQKQQQVLMSEAQQLQKDAPTMTKSDLESKQTALQQQQQQFQQKYNELRQQETSKEQAIAQVFQMNFNAAAAAVAKTGNYNLILSSQAVAYISPDLNADVTDKIIAEMKKDNSQSGDAKADNSKKVDSSKS